MLKYSPLILLLFSGFEAIAQAGSTTEAAVNLEATFIDGNREKLLGNWDKAVAKFQEVLEKDPRNDAAAYELARVYEALKETDKALASAKNAVEWNPANDWYKIYLAELYQKNNKDKEAAALYEQMVKSTPFNEENYFQWAYYLVRAGEPQQAIKVYDNLEKKIGINEETTRRKHTLYLGIGDYKKAGKELETLIEAFPQKTAYRHLLATFYQQIEEKDKAKEVYNEILRLDPGDARAKIALAEETKGGGDIQFLNSLKPIFENPNVEIDVKIKEILPYVTMLAEHDEKSLGTTLLGLTSILEQVHPGDAKTWSVLGDVLYYSGEPAKALEKYKKCLELDGNVWPVWEQALNIFAGQNDYAQLIAFSEKALEIFPNQASAYYFNGLGYNAMGKYDDALASFQQALMMSSKNPQQRYAILNETGKAWFYLEKYSRSDEAFEEALKINANDPLVLMNYSHFLAARNEHLDKAKDLATRLVKAAPGTAGAEDALAFVLYKMKDYKTAKDWLEKALQHGGQSNPVVLEHYGDVLFQTGNTAQALEYWQEALENGGTSELLKKKVKEGKLVE
ncbi:MAG: tetratricopeptide repeat protein [Saprospiraceae bacterium]|nr:MAG: tetratricopeptide repeat protein [Saprospiraceae bacterium]